MAEDKPVILIGGQGEGTALMLSEVVAALNELRKDCYVVVRPHPRTKDDHMAEMAPIQRAIAQLKIGTPVFDFFGKTDTQSLLASADCVLSMYSTVLIEAAILQKQNIAVLYPDEGKRVWDNANNGKVKDFPLVDLGATAKATNRSELIQCIRCAFDDSLGLYAAQRKHFAQDGTNARRIADFICSLL